MLDIQSYLQSMDSKSIITFHKKKTHEISDSSSLILTLTLHATKVFSDQISLFIIKV